MRRHPQAIPQPTAGPTATNADVWRCLLAMVLIVGGLALLVFVAGGAEMLGGEW